MDKLDKLTSEYAMWCSDNDMPLISADELILKDSITPLQKEWLIDYIKRWDKAVEEDLLND